MIRFDKKIPLKSQTYTLYDFFNQKNRNRYETGFFIPDYQRHYNWNEKNINELLESCFKGYNNYTTTKRQRLLNNCYCYLGTLILLENEEQEDLSEGVSLSVVDGQQRITTLVLMAIALFCEILNLKIEINFLNDDEKEWLKSEINFQLQRLYECAIGDRGYEGPFPRIVRIGDVRGVENDQEKNKSEHNSNISKFLNNFKKLHSPKSKKFDIGVNDIDRLEKFLSQENVKNDDEYEKLLNKYKGIRAKVTEIYKKIDDDDDDDSVIKFKLLSVEDIKSNNNITNLFKNNSEERAQKIITNKKPTGCLDLFRVLLFSSYFLDYIALTQVKVEEESLGFDIFDALNTTGEPLTALETLKPLMIKYYDDNKRESYKGSKAETAYNTIEEKLNSNEEDKERQVKVKELVISFALYLNGARVSMNLKEQREYLRSNFINLPPSQKQEKHQEKLQEKFIKEIANMAEYRSSCWEKDGINELIEFEDRAIPLCFRLISDMRTSMAIPALARYWVNYQNSKGGRNAQEEADNFASTVKAITAFIVIRRAATEGTKGIDGDFANLMQKDKLCLGLNQENELLTLPALKEILIKKLKKTFSENLSYKDPLTSLLSGNWWVNRVINNPLYEHSREVAKFLILASSHYSNPCTDFGRAGLLIKDKSERDDDDDFLNNDAWKDDKNKTVEHIAPAKKNEKVEKGWAASIYINDKTRHTVGNLTLLPYKENKDLGNASWDQKKIFYLAATEEKISDVEERIEDMQKIGLALPPRMKNSLMKGKKLPILKPIKEAILKEKIWDLQLINSRSENIAKLTWNKISLWLFDDPHQFEEVIDDTNENK